MKIHAPYLKDLPSNFNKLSELEELQLSYTMVKNPLEKLRRLPKLSKLTLYGPLRPRLVISLEINPGDFPALKKLEIWSCKFDKLQGLGGLQNLTELNLRGVLLNDSQSNWRFPPGLQKLTLGGMGLRKAPLEIGTLAELRSLNLSDNCLKDLPPEFRNLKKLKWLDLSDTGIRMLPKFLMKFPELKYNVDPESEYYGKNCGG